MKRADRIYAQTQSPIAPRLAAGFFVAALSLAAGASCSGAAPPEPTSTVDPSAPAPAAPEPAATPTDPAIPEAAPPDSTASAEAGPGPGAALVQERCASCHGLDKLEGPARSRATWEAIVETMIGKGAELDASEREAVIEHLASR